MDCNLFCLVDASGHVYVKDGAASHAEVAAEFGLDSLLCDSYHFDLSARRLLVVSGRPASDRVATAYWDRHIGSPEKLMTFAAEGRLTKQAMGSLLGADQARVYFDACAVIEKQFTADCTAKSDPGLDRDVPSKGRFASNRCWRPAANITRESDRDPGVILLLHCTASLATGARSATPRCGSLVQASDSRPRLDCLVSTVARMVTDRKPIESRWQAFLNTTLSTCRCSASLDGPP